MHFGGKLDLEKNMVDWILERERICWGKIVNYWLVATCV